VYGGYATNKLLSPPPLREGNDNCFFSIKLKKYRIRNHY